jgi:hypothetical protein
MSVSSVCPRCYQSDGYVNIGRSHIGICKTHRLKWGIGAKLFSSWQDETQADWDRNEAMIAGYREIEPAEDPRDEAKYTLRNFRDSLDALYGSNVEMNPDADLGDLIMLTRLVKQLNGLLERVAVKPEPPEFKPQFAGVNPELEQIPF